MRICTYNIHGGKDAERRPSLPQIVETLRGCDADVILLQEVDRYLARSGFQDQAGVLAHQLNRIPHFYGRLRFGWSAFGNAILTREKPSGVQRLALPSVGGEPRCAIGTRLDFGDVGVVTVWNTHLGLDNRWRQTQLGALAAKIGTGADVVIVGGDFNARIEDAEVQEFLAKTGLSPVTGPEPTFPVPNPTSRIDFLFARGLRKSSSAADPAAGSDHCLLRADLALTDH